MSQIGAKEMISEAVVVAQLVEQALPTPDVWGLNPVIGKLLYRTFVYCQLYWKDEHKEKEAGNGPFLKIWIVKQIPMCNRILGGPKAAFRQWLCGSVGRAVASNSRGPRFKSSHRQNLFILNICLQSTGYWKN